MPNNDSIDVGGSIRSVYRLRPGAVYIETDAQRTTTAIFTINDESTR